ncbi:MAG: septum formation protein Maf [Candidatus Kerfeldbacteria bacterium RIFCSPHIGHO2_12_FULL_48_17]|uniref:Nucleoside triphosphate pyrophosphatase n=1 Tax=Candidatus Kerfeldbacteria bacterium RIFCSPHIGHO2_12_FULL_48_17 TaxID=1798542 RepID=A0A1G2B3Q1_9BACT|nr:MAG: septum formation protein Maf [Candidatus Kerfeldbacteria bacterium RIFCSPHIGHO2_12_FULL_48_17]
MKKIILASASANRKQLLEQIGVEFEVQASNYEEDMTLDMKPTKLAEFLSLGKARDVASQYKNAIIIAADTFIVYKRQLIGKPKDRKDAARIMQLLSGQTHQVITGFTVIDTATGQTHTQSVTSKMTFRKIAPREIKAYVARADVLTKAGAYAIQKEAVIFVEKIDGSLSCVIGLPLTELIDVLKKFGVDVWGKQKASPQHYTQP